MRNKCLYTRWRGVHVNIHTQNIESGPAFYHIISRRRRRRQWRNSCAYPHCAICTGSAAAVGSVPTPTHSDHLSSTLTTPDARTPPVHVAYAYMCHLLPLHSPRKIDQL